MLIANWRQAPQSGSSDWRWPHFSARELVCKCSGRFCAGEYWHDPDFLDALEELRARMAAPLRILSAHRCALHNAAVGGAPLSAHKKIAADVALDRHEPIALSQAAQALGFVGQGHYRTFIHLDRRRARHWFGDEGARRQWQDWRVVHPH